MTEELRIDPYLFEFLFDAFRKNVEEEVGVNFVSFASHPYIEDQESYKYEIHRAARKALDFQNWTKSDIGSGKIINAMVASIEIHEKKSVPPLKNNLVPWESRFGEGARPHQPLYEARNNPKKQKLLESCFYKLYHEQKDEESFGELLGAFGKTYPLLAYFYFIKDRSKYVPIRPTSFDRVFELLGVSFKTSHRCSWANYSTFIDLIGELKNMLSEQLSAEVTLLDAHSFAWMISGQISGKKKPAVVQEYLDLSSTEREAIIKARIGQGQFRKSLIEYWSVCAVTGCAETRLLRASHIKPWAESTVTERLALYNGLLLTPTLDACFDSGFVSFDDAGNIIISDKLSNRDLIALGINQDMRLSEIEPKHLKYLEYHRKNIFR